MKLTTVFTTIILLTTSFTTYAMGGKNWCDVVSELPDCPHKLTVYNGTGDGEYKENEIVRVKADERPREIFIGWSGEIEHLKDPKADTTDLIMPAFKVKIAANYQVGPSGPCDVDPTSQMCACEQNPNGLVCKPCVENDPRPECVTEPQPADFDWSKVKKYGGPEIGIAKDIADWPITRKFKLKSISGMKLNSSIDGKAYEPAIDGLSGNFAMAAEQEDGKWIVGTIDYCRASYQTVKTLANLEYGGTMAESFGLHKGQKVCFFYTGLSRSNKRNVKERSQLECTNWPY